MAKVDQDRVIALQKSLCIALAALNKIAKDEGWNHVMTASDAVDEIEALARKAPLQGVVGHGRNVR